MGAWNPASASLNSDSSIGCGCRAPRSGGSALVGARGIDRDTSWRRLRRPVVYAQRHRRHDRHPRCARRYRGTLRRRATRVGGRIRGATDKRSRDARDRAGTEHRSAPKIRRCERCFPLRPSCARQEHGTRSRLRSRARAAVRAAERARDGERCLARVVERRARRAATTPCATRSHPSSGGSARRCHRQGARADRHRAS